MNKITDIFSQKAGFSQGFSLSSKVAEPRLNPPGEIQGVGRTLAEPLAEPPIEPTAEPWLNPCLQVQFDAKKYDLAEPILENYLGNTNEDVEKSAFEPKEPISQGESLKVGSATPEMPTDQCVRWCWKDKQPYIVVGAVGDGAYRIKRVGKEHAESTVVSKVIWDTQFVEGVKA